MDRRSFFRSLITPAPSATTSASTLAQWVPDADNPWDVNAVNHVYHRLGFGATFGDIQTALAMTPSQLIDRLMDESLVTTAMPDPPEGSEKWLEVMPYRGPEYATLHEEEGRQFTGKVDIRNWWTVLMSQSEPQLREKLTLFWHNHFVVEEVKVYFVVHLYRYFQYLRGNCWGDLRQIVKDVTIMPAMLKYLDGIWSEQDMINENYAREVMELFTMGIADRDGNKNYTQEDVRNLAYAVTGWRFRFEEPPPNVMPPYFADYYFDFNTSRSIWGSIAKVYGLEAAKDPRIEADVIELMFTQRRDAIAWHIAQKVYRHFVYRGDPPDGSDDIVQELAGTLLASDWNMKPMFEKLFKSEHFFDRRFRGAAIKSPYEFMIGVCRKLNIQVTMFESGSIAWYGSDTGMYLDSPTNVKGWEGYRTWLNTSTLPKRINYMLHDLLLSSGVQGRIINPHTGFNFDPIVFGDTQVTAWAQQFDSYAGDLTAFVHDVNAMMLAIELPPERERSIIEASGVLHPYEWSMMTDDAKVQPVRRILFSIMSAPEFQLA